MKKYSQAFFLTLFFLHSFAQSQHEQGLQKISQKLTAAEISDDLKAFLSYYDDSAISMPPYQPLLHGLPQIESFYKEIFRRQHIKTFESKANEFLDYGGTVIEFGTFKKQYIHAGEDTVRAQNGKYCRVWQVQANGDLKIKGESIGFFHGVQDPATLVVPVHHAILHELLPEQVPMELRTCNALNENYVRSRAGALRAGFYDDKALIFPFADKPRAGSEIKPYLIAYSSGGQVILDSVSVTTYRYQKLNDDYLEYFRFRVKWRSPQSPGKTEGHGIRIWKRQADRSLKMYREMGTHIYHDFDDLNRFRAAYGKSLVDKDPEAMQAYYDEDIRLMTEYQKTVMGKTNALKYFKALLSRFDIQSYNRSETEILDLGAMIVETGVFTIKTTLKATSKQYELKGKYIDIWKKEQGKPVLITEAWNYDSQPDFSAQLRVEQVPVVDVALQPHLPVNDPIRFEMAALNRLMEAAVSQHDAPLWAQFYSDNAILFAQRHSLYRGRKEIDEYMKEHIRELPIFEKLDIRNDRIDNLGHYVIEYASHIANWRNGASSGVGLGKDLRIWRREEGGGLKIFRHIGMYD